MPSSSQAEDGLERQGQIAAVVVVVLGYAATFIGTLIGASFNYTLEEAVFAVLLGLVYVFLLVIADDYFARFPLVQARVAYFSLQLALVSAVQYTLLGPGTWLIPLPIVGIAVEHVSPRGRWPIYLTTVFGLTLAVGFRTGDWTSALNIPLLLTPAILFVVIVTQLRLNERGARQQAEDLSRQLAAAHDQLATYAVQAEELATTKERNRLAREIHDNLGHFLTVTNVQLEAARVMLASEPERALDALNKAQDSTRKGLAAVRRAVAALRESPVANRPLPEALDELFEQTRNAGILVEFGVEGEARRTDEKTELALYRVAQESLTNVRKHARASRVDVSLDYRDEGYIRMVVRDNGVGTTSIEGGFGLIGMRERIQLLQGDLLVETTPGKGFELKAHVPG